MPEFFLFILSKKLRALRFGDSFGEVFQSQLNFTLRVGKDIEFLLGTASRFTCRLPSQARVFRLLLAKGKLFIQSAETLIGFFNRRRRFFKLRLRFFNPSAQFLASVSVSFNRCRQTRHFEREFPFFAANRFKMSIGALKPLAHLRNLKMGGSQRLVHGFQFTPQAHAFFFKRGNFRAAG